MVGVEGLKVKLVEAQYNLLDSFAQIKPTCEDEDDEDRDFEIILIHHLPGNSCSYTDAVLTTNSVEVFMELLHNDAYRALVKNHWKGLLSILVTYPNPAPLDYEGGALAQAVLLRAVETEDALHWLSTLGGAYSNLGEGSLDRARQAGRNALKQLAVVGRDGDVTMAMKCWLFIGQSLVQQGRFKAARRILRSVWAECHKPQVSALASTPKLVNMCQGIWNRLVHEQREAKRSQEDEAQIEVEQKFVVPEDCGRILAEAGGKLLGEKEMVDRYRDDRNLSLLSNDYWLRQRSRDSGNVWELKLPAGRRETGGTIYREVSDPKTIKMLLKEVGVVADFDHLDLLVEVSCKREEWNLEIEGMAVVVDRMEDGYAVGEVETMMQGEGGREEALARVKEVASKLGLTPQMEGKVERRLRLSNPRAYSKLKEMRLN